MWSGDPFPAPAELHRYADPFLCIASLGDCLADVTVGIGVTDVIRRMPATLAQAVSTLTHLVSGPLILGVGAGESMNYRPFGREIDSPGRVFREGARRLRHYLDETTPDSDGGLVGIRPRSDRPRPQLWLAAHGPKGLAVTGEIADGWIPTTMSVARWDAARKIVVESALERRRRSADIVLGLASDVVLQDSHEAAHRLLDHPAVKMSCLLLPPAVFHEFGFEHPLGGTSSHSLVATLHGDQLARAAQEVPFDVVHDQVIHGEPHDVSRRIRQYDGLQHVRLSDMSGLVAPGGGLERLIAVVGELHRDQFTTTPSPDAKP